MSERQKKEIVFHGIATSPGIAIGSALVIREHSKSYVEPAERDIPEDKLDDEIARFNNALDKTREELEELQRRVQTSLEAREASIFDAHLLIVDDQMLMNEVEEMIRRKRKSAEYSFFKVIERYVTAISVMPDQYIKERAIDIKDVASRVLATLQDLKRPALDHLPPNTIIIAYDLTPSDTALIDRENVLALAIETGSNTSHTAILARSMQIPAVVSLHEVLQVIENQDEIIVDGFVGTLIVHPDPKTRELYEIKAAKEEKFYVDLIRESRLRPETIDGYTVQLAANLETLADIEAAKKFGTYGVGLFRTEYMYMNPSTLPTETMMFNTFRSLITEMNGKPVVIRTLDIGGDKLEETISVHHEPNPFLGLRAIRLCLRQRRDLLRDQIRAILRASAYGNLKIMFPMISCSEEIMELGEFLDEIKAELRNENTDFNENIDTGIMVETPAAAMVADTLAEMVDFFSIGTNDLVQYTSAIDRSNDKVSYLYRPEHPAILRLIKRIVKAARDNNIWVSICGEMAGDPRYTPLLVGLGVHELSMSPVSMGAVRRIIRKLNMHEAEEVARQALKCKTSDDALKQSLDLLGKISPEITSLALKGL